MIPKQCKAARALAGWGVRDLAKAADVAALTVSRLERGDKVSEQTIGKLRDAFEGVGVVFIEQNGGGPGVRLAKPLKRKRSR